MHQLAFTSTKRDKKHSFKKRDLPSIDKILLSPLTAAAIYACQIFFFLFLQHRHWTSSNRRKTRTPTYRGCDNSVLRWVGGLSLGSSNHSTCHWWGLWAVDNATLLLKQSQQKKERVGSIAASKTCYLPHLQGEDIKAFLHFPLILQKGYPYVLKWESDFDIHYTNIETCCLSKLSRGHNLSNLTR